VHWQQIHTKKIKRKEKYLRSFTKKHVRIYTLNEK